MLVDIDLHERETVIDFRVGTIDLDGRSHEHFVADPAG